MPSFVQSIRATWQRISLVQRALLVAIFLACAITGLLLTKWASVADMRMLYQGLAPDEAAKITEKISDQSIPYELRAGGTSIYVPQKHVYQLRLEMAKEGLPTSSQTGYKILEKLPIGMSPRVQQVNLNRALEEELAKTIQIMDGVAFARVHLVRPDETVFGSGSENITASVALQLRPGYRLAQSSVAAITHLVAGSVNTLRPENVTVVDSSGQLLTDSADDAMTGGAGGVMDYIERVEHNLAKKVEDMLITVLGPGRASVKVSAIIDMTRTSSVTESYDPEKKVPRKEEIKSKTKTESSAAQEQTGQTTPSSTEKDETILTDFALTKTIKETLELPGQVTSLSVSAVVDLSAPVETTGEEGEETQETTAGTGELIMSLQDVEALIKNALGLKETDSLQVRNARFYRPPPPSLEQATNWRFYIDIARHASLGILAICALLVLRIFAGARKKAVEAAAGAALPAGTESMGLLPAGRTSTEPAMLRRQIAGALKQNPKQVKQLFASWLEEQQEQ